MVLGQDHPRQMEVLVDESLKSVLDTIVRSLQESVQALMNDHMELAGLRRWQIAMNQVIQKLNPNMQMAVDVAWRQIIARQDPQTPDATLLALQQTQRSLASISELLRT